MKRVLCFLVIYLIGCAPQFNSNSTPISIPASAIPTTLASEKPPNQTTQDLERLPQSTSQAANRAVEQSATAEMATITPTSQLQVCSPFDAVTLSELQARVVNPYLPPRMGSDDPHQGVDLAELMPDTNIAISGLPVRAILAGRVAGVIRDRFPYGNAILIETQLDPLEDQTSSFPTPLPALITPAALTCPEPPLTFQYQANQRSLYVLYAHLKEIPIFETGQPVECSDVIGVIGDSGNALNPHLHLEMRLGPAGAQIPSMAHYDSTASVDEMALYCIWRVSGLFQHLDPLQFLQRYSVESPP
jgi:murein DD-endopeptidase MepM/ murein hydrolase activator NlpD